MERYEEAMLDIEEALKIDVNYALAYSMKGKIYVEQKKYDLAIKEYERGIALKR